MYVVGELGNTVTGYAVSYGAGGGMGFSEIGTVDTFGGKGVPAGAAAAEIVVKVCWEFPWLSGADESGLGLVVL